MQESAVARAAHAITRLRAVAEQSSGAVQLGPGVSESIIDSWPVPVPDEIRLLASEIGEIRFDEYDSITFTHPENTEPRYCRAGAPGAWWVLHTNSAAEIYYADIDPERGTWGRVFFHWEDNSTTLVAPSVTDWFLRLAAGFESALRVAGGERIEGLSEWVDDDELEELDFASAFSDWFFRSGEIFEVEDTPKVRAVPVLDARHSPDPEVAAAAAGLPEEAVVADLRGAAYPTFVSFSEFHGGRASYRRLAGGSFLAAVGD
ncbi:hypothetical protein [Nocardia yamanashiensis]|uniref:hypothetical protein n=1 Tax=Nocardia yamanashiensis TaxID=209247 RepID=UPI0008318319|nr:hypothetical protein [Nocardia yamanashiensis]